MSISGAPTADQASLLGNRFDMFPVTDAARCRQGEDALVNRKSLPLFRSTPWLTPD
jgi:hypothetical protein